MRKSSVNTLRDKFRIHCRERKTAETANWLASGTVEEVSDTDLLLDELILEAKEAAEQKWRERLAGDDRGEVLVSAGEESREAGATRMAKCALSTVGVGEGRSSGCTPKRKVRWEDDCMAVWQTMIKLAWDSRWERDEKRLALRAEELELEKKRYRDDKEEREQRKREHSAQLQLLNASIKKTYLGLLEIHLQGWRCNVKTSQQLDRICRDTRGG